jgi:hypothetical protein
VKNLVKVILFLITFTIEIKVKAATVNREPARCDQSKTMECLLFSGAVGGKVKLANANIYLGHDTLMYRDLQNMWHLVRGVVKIESHDNFEVSTMVGRFTSEKSEYILQQLEQQSYLFVLSGKVLPVVKSPVSSPYQLSTGYTNWYGPIDSTGFNREGFPRPLVWKKFANQVGFENWYLIIKEKHKIKDNESVVIENSSRFYLDIVQAMEKIRLDRQVAEENRKRAISEEASTVRQLFRKKFEIESLEE